MLIYQIELSASAGISAVTYKLQLTSIDNFIYLKQTLDSPWVSFFLFTQWGLVFELSLINDVKKDSISILMKFCPFKVFILSNLCCNNAQIITWESSESFTISCYIKVRTKWNPHPTRYIINYLPDAIDSLN